MGSHSLRTVALAIVIAFMLQAATAAGVEAQVSSTSTVVNRIFYLSQPNTLSSITPSSAGSPVELNLTDSLTGVDFDLPNLILSPVTVDGSLSVTLWLNTTSTTTLRLNVTLSVRSISGNVWNNGTSPFQFTRILPPDILQRYNFTVPIDRTLTLGDHVFIGIRAKPSVGTSATLLWGVADYASFIVLPLSGHVAFQRGKSVDILTAFPSQVPATEFDLNSSVPNVIFQIWLTSALGKQEIQRVNLTIVDPGLNPVRGGTNLSMFQFPESDPQGPYVFTTNWVYPSNATEGIYQVYIDVFDVQDSRVFSFRGPATFRLFRPSIFSQPPLSLLPYFGAGGVAAITGALYYRRRRSKSYLVPFDHFNTLTGGEIAGGNVVAIEGNTGSGKTVLSQQLMFEDLKNGRPCVYIATGDFPSNVRVAMKNLGLDTSGYEQSGLLTFVDGYSSEAGQESKEKISVPSLGDLTTLGTKITSSLPSGSFKGGSLYFDSLTPLASKAKPESIVSLIQSVGARVRGMSGKAFFTLGPSLDPKVLRQLEEMSDCVVQMEAFEERGVRKSRLKIAKHRARKHQQGWILYTVEDGKGIIFYSKRPHK